jgi:cell division septum initiation protein DivIVA
MASKFGIPIANDLRELAVTLKKIGITANQCAAGFRIAMILIKCGVGENEFLSFVSQIYDGCKKLDLSPEKIISHLKDLLYFSESMSLSQIRDYVEQKASEKRRLEKDIENMRTQIQTLEQEKSYNEELRDNAVKHEKITIANLQWYSNLKTELNKYRIPIEDLSLFAKAVHGIGQYGYDVNKIIAIFSELDFLRRQLESYRHIIPALENKSVTLNRVCTFLGQILNFNRQKLSQSDELEQIGFGLKELKLIWHTINEIAEANNISSDQAVQKFFKDVEEQYDDKLGFELKLDRLRSEFSALNKELNSSQTALLAQPLVGPAIQRLFYNGVSEQDIIYLSKLFERLRRSEGDIDKQSLISELEKYGSIESAIEQLNQKIKELKNEVASLESQRNELSHQNQQILDTVSYCKEVSGFFRGAVFSLRNEILMQLVLLGYINWILNLQTEEIKMSHIIVNSRSEACGESLSQLIPLIRAAKFESDGNGELVPIDELKISVIRAIDILIDNLNHNIDNKKNNNNGSHPDSDGLIEILNQTRITLENKRSDN